MVNQIAIVIPAYNEEENIERLIKNIKHYVGNVLIIVVDDSSNNKISTIIKKKKLDILYFNRGKKLGRGSAIIFGLKKLLLKKKIKAFIEMDADFSHDPSELKRNINLKNFNFLNCPILKIKHIKLTKEQIKEIKVADAIIFSSANAVNISMKYLNSFSNKVFCVGKDTKIACLKNNIKKTSACVLMRFEERGQMYNAVHGC